MVFAVARHTRPVDPTLFVALSLFSLALVARGQSLETGEDKTPVAATAPTAVPSLIHSRGWSRVEKAGQTSITFLVQSSKHEVAYPASGAVFRDVIFCKGLLNVVPDRLRKFQNSDSGASRSCCAVPETG